MGMLLSRAASGVIASRDQIRAAVTLVRIMPLKTAHVPKRGEKIGAARADDSRQRGCGPSAADRVVPDADAFGMLDKAD